MHITIKNVFGLELLINEVTIKFSISIYFQGHFLFLSTVRIPIALRNAMSDIHFQHHWTLGVVLVSFPVAEIEPSQFYPLTTYCPNILYQATSFYPLST